MIFFRIEKVIFASFVKKKYDPCIIPTYSVPYISVCKIKKISV